VEEQKMEGKKHCDTGAPDKLIFSQCLVVWLSLMPQNKSVWRYFPASVKCFSEV